MLIDLAIHPEWRGECKNEIQTLLSCHLGGSLSSATVREKLAAIPLSAWEDELPILEACIRESHRISLSPVTLRRNLHEEIEVGGQVVGRGDFLVYSMADVHLNPEYYPEPYKYDPGRWLRPNPHPSAIYPFLGWGAGRHPCTGVRLAKLELKLILAMFLTRYEFDLVDEDGKFPNPLPVPNRNDIHHQVCVGSRISHFTETHCSFSLLRPAPLELHTTSTSRRLRSRWMATQHFRASSAFSSDRTNRPTGAPSHVVQSHVRIQPIFDSYVEYCQLGFDASSDSPPGRRWGYISF